IPNDVLQVVNGSGREIGEIFTSSEIIRKITFTGSTPVGKSLIKNSADTVKNVTMELGGHAPLIVAEDADIDFAVEQSIASKFRSVVQICVCSNRIIVNGNNMDECSEKYAKEVIKLKVGNRLEENVDIGPIIIQSGYEKIVEQ